MRKIKYITNKIFRIIIISVFSIIFYNLFMELKNNNLNNSTNYGTKIIAEENINNASSVSKMVEKISKNVVGISKIKEMGSSIFLSNSSSELGLGTGIIVSNKGYILTNQHVSGNKNQQCYITAEDGQTYNGKVVWANSDIDLSIIKVNEIFDVNVVLGNSNSIDVGEDVFAIGNPIGYEFQRTVTKGIISAKDRTVKVKNEDNSYSYMSNLIQTDATINPGNSGGPLIDKEGKIIGINTIKITSADGMGFAIPINIIKPIIEKFEKYDNFDESFLGIYAYDFNVILYLNEENNYKKGVYIDKIIDNSPAQNSQLQKGDIIIKIDSTNIEKMVELQEFIFSKNPGDSISLTILRSGQETEVNVILGKK